MDMDVEHEQPSMDDVDFDEGEVVVRKGGRIPVIEFSDQLEENLARCWSKSVISKLLGRRIGYRALESRLQSMWNFDSFKVLDLGNKYFLIKFCSNAGFQKALLDGLWVINGGYLLTQPWHPSFDTASDEISRAVV